MTPRQVMLRMFEAAIAAASPEVCLPPHLPPRPQGRVLVVGAGKAAASMAKVVEDHMEGPLDGLVVTRYGHGVPLARIEVVEAGHPLPDEAGTDAARRILEKVQGLRADDMVLFLASGGASALLALPAPGITLEEKRAVTSALLRSGASIHEINTVRKHLSAIKGGRLAAAAAPARVVTLAISDVPGDNLSVIGSGPCVPDPTTFAQARRVLELHGITPPEAVARLLADAIDETPKLGELSHATASVVATPRDALDAAAMVAIGHGWLPLCLGDEIEGEAREVARALAGIARSVDRHQQPVPPPAVILSGGETTVTVKGTGRGGRNAEFLLSLAIALDGAHGIHAIACDTDGIDGSEDNAGAIITPDILARARELGLDAKAMLADNDAYGFFEALGDLVMTGPTRTNVNDFRAILVE